jgi:hypothetical protein
MKIPILVELQICCLMTGLYRQKENMTERLIFDTKTKGKQMKLKLCKDCKHSLQIKMPDSRPYTGCNCIMAINSPVDGSKRVDFVQAGTCRENVNMCGREGRWFE